MCRQVLPGVVEDQVNSMHSLEQVPVAPWGDETCKQHQTYSLQFSCRIDTLVDQVSQEIYFPLVLCKHRLEQSLLGMTDTFHDLPYHLFHSDVSHSIEWLQVFVAGHLETKSPFVQHKDSTLELEQGPGERLLVHSLNGQATWGLQ